MLNARWFGPIVFSLAIVVAAASSAETPNIVVIMADDLGYGDLSCYGSKTIGTPHIDRLAASGLRFTSGYCSASTCTPTRFSFLTGTYAFRHPRTGVAPPNAPAIIPPGTETIAAILKRAGYRTSVIGKWHLGLGEKPSPNWNGKLAPGPLEIGFDECCLMPTTNDRVPQVLVENHGVAGLDPKDPLWVGDKQPADDYPTGITHRDSLKMNWSHGHNQTIHNGISRIGFYTGGKGARFRDEDLTDIWVKKSIDFIEKNRERPFFLFLASHAIHVPRIPHERFQGKTTMGYRGDSILEFDWTVGQISETLERLGLAEKTLVIVCSDNGPVLDDGYQDDAIEKLGEHRPAGPLKGGKYSVFEGGTRTPFIASWKGRIAPGVSDEVVCTIDLPASFAALTGQSLATDGCLDSHNVLGALIGEKDARGRDHLVQQNNGDGGTFGYREGNWKLVRHDKQSSFNMVVENRLGPTKVPPIQLFDLSNDVGETKNVAEDHPEIVAGMTKRLAAIIAERSRK